MKKHCFNPLFRYSVAALPITSIPPLQTESKSNLSEKANRYCRDWTSAPHIRLRSGMFKHPNVVPITAAKRDPKQQSKQESIPPSRTGTVLHIAIRQMLAAAHSHQTQVLQAKLQSREPSARTRAKILYMPTRSPDDSCNT
jgi:hypothetical protein